MASRFDDIICISLVIRLNTIWIGTFATKKLKVTYSSTLFSWGLYPQRDVVGIFVWWSCYMSKILSPSYSFFHCSLEISPQNYLYIAFITILITLLDTYFILSCYWRFPHHFLDAWKSSMFITSIGNWHGQVCIF